MKRTDKKTNKLITVGNRAEIKWIRLRKNSNDCLQLIWNFLVHIFFYVDSPEMLFMGLWLQDKVREPGR